MFLGELEAQTKESNWFQKTETNLTTSEIDQALKGVKATTILQKGALTFVVKAKADSVKLMSPFRGLMTKLENGIWVVSYQMQEVDQSMFSWQYVMYEGESTTGESGPFFRGTSAKDLYPRVKLLEGNVSEHQLYSKALSESRKLSVYLPPNHDPGKNYPVLYMTDGHDIPDLAESIDPLIVAGRMQELIMVGVHTSAYEGSYKPDLSDFDILKDMRTREYNKGFLAFIGKQEGPDPRFENHMTFFRNEVANWAEQNFGASAEKRNRMVTGASNGGSFVASLTTQFPGDFGAAIINSLSWSMAVDTLIGEVQEYPRFYLAAGRYEPGYLKTAEAISNKLVEYGATVSLAKRFSGHDKEMWCEEVINGLKDYLGEDRFPENVMETLEALFEKDQAIRLLLGKLQKKRELARTELGEETDEFKSLQVKIALLETEMLTQDGKNTAGLEPIISQYGWPHISSSSKLANKAAFFIVQHNFDIQEKYLPLILESASRGETPGKWVALLQDRMRMFKRQEQIYGTQGLMINGKYLIWPIEDDKQVDERRRLIGLKPLADALQNSYGIAYKRTEMEDMPMITFGTPPKKKKP